MSKFAKAAVVAATLATTAAGFAAPASAATPMRAQAIRAEIAQLENRVQRNDWRGHISDREARALRNDVRELSRTFRIYNRDGLNTWEMRTLQGKIRSVKARLQFERHDRDGRRW